MNISSVFDLVADDLHTLQEELAQVAVVDHPIFGEMLRHILLGRGKRLRPAIGFLVTRMGGGDVKRVVPLAVSVELLHTATLVHDDLIDNSLVRRGNVTLNAMASQGVTVLVGDYMFAAAADYANRCRNLDVMDVVAKTVMTICYGELRQIFSIGDLRLGVEEYYRQIESKTATLFAASAECAGLVMGLPRQEVTRLHEYGHSLGMAFQIADDILDFVGDDKVLGKPVGSDLRQGTITLPALYAMQNPAVGEQVIALLERDDDRDANVNQAVQLVLQSPAIDASYKAAAEFVARAKESLAGFPASPYRTALLDLADYAIARKK
ncbi:MAG: polyprenyl synthetase family protein [Dehalococcoidales bacterium]|nr:polyprenyl synthetase family protein [Dehalococcoidales bacterium]